MPEDTHTDVTQPYRFTRLTRVFWALEASLLAMLLLQLLTADYTMVAVFSGLAAALMSVYVLLKNGHASLAAGALFILISLTISGLMWYFHGLRDEAMLAYPALIFFSAVIGGRKLFATVVAIALITVVVIGAANTFGWHSNALKVGDLESASFIVVILLITSYAVWLFNNELQDATRRVNLEIERARDSEIRVKEIAQRDALTGLPNRIAARERFEHAIGMSARSYTKVCMMFLDLDDFKNINDSHGHQTGDEFLLQTAQRLTETVRSTDFISRLGGDEFLVILESVRDAEHISSVAEKILKQIKQPVHLDGSDLQVSASIGIAVAPDDGRDFDTICRQADIAMYHTKSAGRNNFHFFDEAMNHRVQDRLRILSHLKLAAEKQQFELYFQPKIDLKTGAVVGAESLIRWNHPELGLMHPVDFISLAENSGIILDIGAWVIRESCLAGKRWQQTGLGDFSIAANISSIQFSRGNFLELVQDALDESGLAPQSLELELTETLLIDNTGTIKETLEKLRKLGVVLSIDDFGTGYSNLGYLKSFDVSVLKIDRSFISKILSSEHDRVIVEAIMQVASRLDLKVVAEGVENKEVADIVRILGCDMAQGYYWSAPLNADDFEAFLQQRVVA